MSKEKRTIEITPGQLSQGGRMTEVIESQGHKCRTARAMVITGKRTSITTDTKRNAQYVKAAVSLMQ